MSASLAQLPVIESCDGCGACCLVVTRPPFYFVFDASHVMVGAGCEDWGVCVYLSVADARRLHSELGRILTELGDAR